MKRFVAAPLGFGIILLGLPAVGQSADQRPPEPAKAKVALGSAQASLTKSPQVANGQEIEAPRSPWASARAEDAQAPRARSAVPGMTESKRRSLPVIDADARVLGVVSRNDLMVAIAPEAG